MVLVKFKRANTGQPGLSSALTVLKRGDPSFLSFDREARPSPGSGGETWMGSWSVDEGNCQSREPGYITGWSTMRLWKSVKRTAQPHCGVQAGNRSLDVAGA